MPSKIPKLDRTRLDELSRLLQRLDQLRNELGTIAADKQRAVQHHQQIQQAGRGLVQQRDSAKNERVRLETEHEKLRKLCDELEEDIAARRQTARQLQRAIKRTNEKIVALQEQIADLEREAAQQQRGLRRLVAEAGQIAELRQELLRQRAECEQAERKALVAQAAIQTQAILPAARRRAEQIIARRLQEARARLAEIDDELIRASVLRVKVRRRHDDDALTTQRQATLDQLAQAKQQLADAERALVADEAALNDLITEGKTLKQKLGKAQTDRDNAGLARGTASNDEKALSKQVKDTHADYETAGQRLAAVNTGHDDKVKEVALAERGVEAALNDAVDVATAGLATLQTNIASFGATLPIVPQNVQAELDRLDQVRRNNLLPQLGGIVPDIQQAAAHAATLTQLFNDLDRVFNEYNATVDEVQRAIRALEDERRMSVVMAAQTKCNTGEWMNAFWCNDDLTRGQELVSMLNDQITTNMKQLLTNFDPISQQLLSRVDQLLRRYRIFQLRPKYTQMCFFSRLDAVLTTCLTQGTTLANTLVLIDNLRRTPTLDELRRLLGVPVQADVWTLWGTTDNYLGTEIHVTISYDSVQALTAAIDTYPNGTALANALCILPPNDTRLEIHATLNVSVNAQNQHPHVYYKGQPGLWNRYRTSLINLPNANLRADQQAVRQTAHQAAQQAAQQAYQQAVHQAADQHAQQAGRQARDQAQQQGQQDIWGVYHQAYQQAYHEAANDQAVQQAAQQARLQAFQQAYQQALQQAAQQHEAAARTVCMTLLNQYKAHLGGVCQTALNHVANGRDILGHQPQ